MADQPGSIKKDKKLPQSQDFNYLKSTGIGHIQRLSGNIWTDYNAHDPGVTILEQFCYGLTDLGYRAAFPIEDLLMDSSDGRINWKKNSFYSPALVFSSHPVTVIDFRKLLIDSFPEIQNAWVYPKNPQSGEEQINGVFTVEILPSLAFQKALRKNPELESFFLDYIGTFLQAQRNLGEEFDYPQLLKPQPIVLEADLEISEEEDPDRVMAAVLFDLEVHLYHPVAYANLEELLSEKIRLEHVFSGPRLTGGFIRDSELKPRPEILYAERFQHLITQVKGVKKCWNLSLNRQHLSKSIKLTNGCYASLNTDYKDAASVFSTLTVLINGNPQRLDRVRVTDMLLELWSKNYRQYQMDLFRESFLDSRLRGRFRAPVEYVSIQHHFPMIYGIGKEGISKHEPIERQAKVKQLKGYLLLMEQHLANYLAQLAHISDFFDPDADPHSGTYYSQRIDSVIGIEELERKAVPPMSLEQLGYNPLTGETRIAWLERKNRVLDHLLARFGETVSELPFQISRKLNLIESEEQLRSKLLLQKSRLLNTIADLNYAKQKGQNLSQEGEDMRSSLGKLLHIQLGIDHSGTSLLADIQKSAMKNMDAGPRRNFQGSTLSITELTQRFRPLSRAEKDLDKTLHLPSPAAYFGRVNVSTLFSAAVDPDSYWISKRKSKKGAVEVLFQKAPDTWVSLWEGSDKEEALAKIASTIRHFRQLNQRAEGFYLVDHILLRDLCQGTDYGFMLLDEWGNVTMKSSWADSEESRNTMLAHFYRQAIKHSSYRKKANSISVLSDNGVELASYPMNADSKRPSLEEVITSTEGTARLMSDSLGLSGALALQEVEGIRLKGTLHRDGGYHQRRVIFVRKLADGREVREDFFDLKATLVLPDWPARFQEKHFRSFLEKNVRERIPAHMEVAIIWANVHEIQKFETAYFSWLKLKKDSTSKKTLLVDAAYRVYSFIQEQKGGMHEG